MGLVVDNKLQILLRRYAETGLPEDAEALARNMLRVAENRKVSVWVVQSAFDPDAEDSVTLFATEAAAYKQAALYVNSAVEDEILAYEVYSHQIPVAIGQFQELYQQGFFREAVNFYNSSAFNSVNTAVINVYQQEVE